MNFLEGNRILHHSCHCYRCCYCFFTTIFSIMHIIIPHQWNLPIVIDKWLLRHLHAKLKLIVKKWICEKKNAKQNHWKLDWEYARQWGKIKIEQIFTVNQNSVCGRTYVVYLCVFLFGCPHWHQWANNISTSLARDLVFRFSSLLIAQLFFPSHTSKSA